MAAWRAAAEEKRRVAADANPAGRDVMRALEDAGLAMVTLVLPDAETGSGYGRQWHIPLGQAEAFADAVTRNLGDAAEFFIDATDAAQAAEKMILAVTPGEQFRDPGDDG